MNFSVLDLLMLIGALGFFIYGMKMMSEGIQKVAGNKMRMILRTMTKNRVVGVISGFLITILVQSSSATTVMTVSFVNAGLLSLVESAGIMMGANIGTTITAWIVSIFGFKIKIAAFSLPIIAIGTPMLFSSKSNLKSWGETLIGFALLFMGLNELKNTVPDLNSNPELLSFLASYTDMGMLSTLLFIGIGTALTVLVQSSSAAMALTLVMCHQGWIPFENAAAMVLGENIGTTITANLAALIGNVHAKRSARFHSLFNLIGVFWMIFCMPLFLSAINYVMVNYVGMVSPYEKSESIPIALSYFHTAFNVTNVILLIWFLPSLVKLATKMVRSKGEDDEMYHLEHIGKGIVYTPELSILEANKEVNKFCELAKRMTGFIPPLLTEKDKKTFSATIERLKKYEDITDRIEVEVVSFLSKTAQSEISEETANDIRGLLRIVSNLEKIGDLNYHMGLALQKKTEEKAWFTPEQRNYLIKMFHLIDKAFDIMIENFNKESHQINLQNAIEIEEEINSLRQEMSGEHFKSIENGDYNIKSGLCYNKLYNSLEKVGDHILNVNEAASGLNIE